ncbi:MAG: SulP family inorganic anion transporter [Pseudomonadota bacterium]
MLTFFQLEIFRRFIPFMKWMPGLTRADIKCDVMAGLTGAVIVLPQGVAFATIAGMPPEYGLYAGMVPAIIAALFGSSRHLVSGPTTAASIVMFSSLSVLAVPGSFHYVELALTLTFMVGIMQLALGFARMGALVNFISHSVIVGFTAGAALLIASKQLGNFFGVTIPRGGHVQDILYNFYVQLPTLNYYVLSVGVVTLVSGIAFKKWLPRIPFMIAAMVIGGIVATVLNAYFGQSVTGIKTVGALPNSLPPLSAPVLTAEAIRDLAPAALAMTLFALTEAVSIGRSLAARSGHRIDGNQEFVGQGLSNLAGSFFSGYVATGSFNRSGLNFQAGAKSPVAAILAGALLMLIVVLVAPLAAYLPNASMAAILFMVAWGLIDLKEIKHILRSTRNDSVVMAVTFFGALFLELEVAILAGVMLSLIIYLMRVARPNVATLAPDPSQPKNAFTSDPELAQCPQLRFLRVDGSPFFGNVNVIQDEVERVDVKYPGQKHLAVLADGINFADISGCDALEAEATRRQKMGGGFYLINVKPKLWLPLAKSGAMQTIGTDNIFKSKQEAIGAIYDKLDRNICQTCEARVFRECQSI